MNKDNARANRRYKNFVKAKKQLDILKNYGLAPENVILNRYKKQSPLNCGRSHCFMCCNPRKTFGYITLKEEIALISYNENMKETL